MKKIASQGVALLKKIVSAVVDAVVEHGKPVLLRFFFICGVWVLLVYSIAIGVMLGLSMLITNEAAAQNYPGGFYCHDAGSGSERLRALTRTDGHVAYFQRLDGPLVRFTGCGGSSVACVNAVRGCFGAEIGLETPLGEIALLEGPEVGRTISWGVGIWFALFAVGVMAVLLRFYFRFRAGGKGAKPSGGGGRRWRRRGRG